MMLLTVGRTSWSACYSGLNFPTNLPMASAEDKAKILGLQAGRVGTPKNWVRAGLPVFWQETKGEQFWESFLDDLKDWTGACHCF